MPKIRDAALAALAPEKLPSAAFRRMPPDDLVPYEVKNGEVHVTQPFEWLLSVTDGRNRRDVLILGQVVLAASARLDPNSADADAQWRVLSVEVLRAVPVVPKGPGPG